MADSENKFTSGVNLGLSEILGGQDSAAAPPPSQPNDDTMDLVDAPRAENSLLPPVLDDAVKRGDWSAVMRECEAMLAQGEQPPEIKLIWVQSQAKTGIVPSSILAAPLEAALEAINESTSPDLRRLAGQITKEVGENLVRNDDPLGAVPLLKRSRELGAEISEETRIALQQLRAAIEEKPKVMRSVQEEGALTALTDATFSEVGQTRESSIPAVQRTGTRGGSGSAWFVPSALFLIALGGGYLIIRSLNDGSDSLASGGSSDAVVAVEIPELRPSPVVPALPAVRAPSQLDELLMDVENVKPAVRPDPETGGGTLPAVQRVSLNLTGPLEPAELRDLRLSGGELEQPAEHEKSDDERKVPLFPEPRRTVGAQEQSQFGYARDFRLIARTVVRARPVASSPELEVLPAGTRVRVDAVTIGWLKLVSKSGQIGYIRSSDAVPVD